MDYAKILEPVAGYINFVLHFAGFGALPELRRIGEVSVDALAIFFMGLLLAFVIMRARVLNTFDTGLSDAPPDASPSFKVEGANLLAYIPLLTIAVAFFEASRMLADFWSSASFGSVEDTINAVLVTSGFQYPVQAAISNASGVARRLRRLPGWPKITAGLIMITGGLVQIFMTAHYVWALAQAHGVGWPDTAIPVAISVALFYAAAIPIGLVALWLRVADAHEAGGSGAASGGAGNPHSDDANGP